MLRLNLLSEKLKHHKGVFFRGNQKDFIESAGSVWKNAASPWQESNAGATNYHSNESSSSNEVGGTGGSDGNVVRKAETEAKEREKKKKKQKKKQKPPTLREVRQYIADIIEARDKTIEEKFPSQYEPFFKGQAPKIEFINEDEKNKEDDEDGDKNESQLGRVADPFDEPAKNSKKKKPKALTLVATQKGTLVFGVHGKNGRRIGGRQINDMTSTLRETLHSKVLRKRLRRKKPFKTKKQHVKTKPQRRKRY